MQEKEAEEYGMELAAFGKEEGMVTVSYLGSSYITGSHKFFTAYYEGELNTKKI